MVSIARPDSSFRPPPLPQTGINTQIDRAPVSLPDYARAKKEKSDASLIELSARPWLLNEPFTPLPSYEDITNWIGFKVAMDREHPFWKGK